MELTKEQIAMIKDMQSRGMNTSIIETITGATADQINSVINAPDKEGDQTRLSNEDWLKQADERQLTAESPLFLRDFNYDVTAPQTNKGITQIETPFDEMDDYEAQDIDRERMEELRRLASMEQYPTETEDEQGNWLMNLLNPQRMRRTALSYLGNKAVGLSGLAGIFNPLGWAGAGLAGLGNQLRGGMSQNAFEQARNQRRLQSRKDYMMDRRAQGLEYGEENLANVFKQLGQQDTWQPPVPKTVAPRHAPHPDRGGGGGNVTPGSMGMSTVGGGDPFFNRGGLASLWQR